MNSIITNLSDPSWWFTAFFIAIVASVIAGFLKDKISELLGNAFSGLRRWREGSKAKRDEVVNVMISNQMYFTISLFVMVLKVVMLGISVTMYFTWPIMVVIMPQKFNMVFDLDFLAILFLILGGVTIFVSYKTSATVSLVLDAIHEFRKRNNLPRLP
uniref:hypothetical protein n=1 Tax=Candidatus Electronema sp. TaxID=2698783 RepID=UPI004055DDF0